MPRWKGPCRFGRVRTVAVLLGRWLKRLRGLCRVGIAGFTGLVEAVLLCAELLREIIWVVNAELSHHLLLLCRTGFAGGKRDLESWGRGRCNWCPFVELLAEEVRLVC